MRFLEVFGYFSPAHGYSLHVSFLGLFPILMSANEALKKEAVTTLERGGLLAFGISEQAHGSDLLGNEFTITPIGPDWFMANGSKYYIGNANAASIITILARKQEGNRTGKRAPLVFFILRPEKSPAFCNVHKIRTMGIRAAYVGGFDVKGHEFPQSDLLAEGRDAWEALFGTITLGRFFLGFGSIGICEHAMQESLQHARQRILFGQPVTALPHIAATFAQAYARLTAMKLYAYRALDYVHAANPQERRYQLFTAVQKAKVSTEGVRVIELLAECMGARGFESDTYFEMARRDIQLIPSLEGSTHINYGLTMQFIHNYFADKISALADPKSLILADAPAGENSLLPELSTKNAKDIPFRHFLEAYRPLLAIPNVRIFTRQIRAFRRLALLTLAGVDAANNLEITISLGKCFAIIVYAQLIAQNAVLCGIPKQLTAVIFGGLIGDLASATGRVIALQPRGKLQQFLQRRLLVIAEMDKADMDFVSKL